MDFNMVAPGSGASSSGLSLKRANERDSLSVRHRRFWLPQVGESVDVISQAGVVTPLESLTGKTFSRLRRGWLRRRFQYVAPLESGICGTPRLVWGLL